MEIFVPCFNFRMTRFTVYSENNTYCILWVLRVIFNMKSLLGYLYSSNQHGTVHQN